MTGRRPFDYRLERLAQGELPPARAEAARGARAEPASAGDGAYGELRRSGRVHDALAQLADSDREILAAHPPARVAAAIRRRAGEAPKPARWLWLAAPVAAAAIAVLAFRGADDVGAGPGAGPGGGVIVEGPESTRPKGDGAYLLVYRQRGEAPEQLKPGAAARRGDLLQMRYVAMGARYGVIFSLDGRGVVTPHLPVSGAEAAPLSPRGEVALPESYELDDAPLFERFFLVTGDAPFAAEAALAAGRELAARPAAARTEPLRLPKGLSQTSFLVVKGSR